jgi:pimeloyl-ACP methyl ester carboxylesterase
LALFLALGHAPASGQSVLPGEPAIAYWQIGEPSSDRVIVVVHGGAGVPHDYLRPEWDALAPLGRVVYYDQRGCGLSARPGSYTWQDHVADLERLIAQVSPGRPVVLAGSSWGSTLAAIYAKEHPADVQALVLSGFAGQASRSRRAAVRFLPEIESPGEPDAFWTPEPLKLPGPLLGRRSDQARFFGPIVGRPNPHRASAERARMGEVLAPRFTEDCPETRAATFESLRGLPTSSIYPLTALRVPVLAIVDNRFGIPFDTSAAAPEIDGNVTTVVGGGHDPWFEHRDAFFALVSDFVRGVRAR